MQVIKAQETDTNVVKWGQERLALLQTAYIFLTKKGAMLNELDCDFIEKSKLVDIIGTSSYTMARSMNAVESNPYVVLAERIYQHILSRDIEICNSIDFKESDDTVLFADPLVFSRLASSMFMQDDYSRAKTVIDSMLRMRYWPYIQNKINSGAYDASLMEIHMRHSQYIWFMNYGQSDRMLDGLKPFFSSVEAMFFQRASIEYDEKSYRADLWYILCLNYLKCFDVILPSDFIQHETAVIKKLEDCGDFRSNHRLATKPEIVGGYLSLFNLNYRDEYESIEQSISIIREQSSYPVRTRRILEEMIKLILSRHENIIESNVIKMFISYNHDNRLLVEKILHYAKISRFRLVTDKDFIAGDSIVKGMQEAILQANVCCVIITREYMNSSGWLEKERDAILSRHASGHSRIVIFYQGVAIGEIKEAFPFFSTLLMVNLNEGNLDYQILNSFRNVMEQFETQV
jgi:TIR domain